MGTLLVDVEITTDYYISEISRVEIKNSIIEALKVIIPVYTGRSVESTHSETIMTNRALKKDQFQIIWSRKMHRMKRYIDTEIGNDTSPILLTIKIKLKYYNYNNYGYIIMKTFTSDGLLYVYVY